MVYVTGDVAGREESPVYAILKLSKELDSIRAPSGYAIERYATHLPFMTDRIAMKWDGEWQITYEVFRDLGFAFAVVLVLIYVIVVGWFQSFRVPLVIMAPIPLTLVGILPAHALMRYMIGRADLCRSGCAITAIITRPRYWTSEQAGVNTEISYQNSRWMLVRSGQPTSRKKSWSHVTEAYSLVTSVT